MCGQLDTKNQDYKREFYVTLEVNRMIVYFCHFYYWKLDNKRIGIR
jgi:hypothetical protein